MIKAHKSLWPDNNHHHNNAQCLLSASKMQDACGMETQWLWQCVRRNVLQSQRRTRCSDFVLFYCCIVIWSRWNWNDACMCVMIVTNDCPFHLARWSLVSFLEHWANVNREFVYLNFVRIIFDHCCPIASTTLSERQENSNHNYLFRQMRSPECSAIVSMSLMVTIDVCARDYRREQMSVWTMLLLFLFFFFSFLIYLYLPRPISCAGSSVCTGENKIAETE